MTCRGMLLMLPVDILNLIIHLLTPSDTVVIMATSKALYEVGKHAQKWRLLRSQYNFPAPKPSATRWKTDYSIFMQKACRLCFARPKGRYGFCTACLHGEYLLSLFVDDLHRKKSQLQGNFSHQRWLKKQVRNATDKQIELQSDISQNVAYLQYYSKLTPSQRRIKNRHFTDATI